MLAVADPEVAARAAQRAQPGPGAGHGLGRPRPARLQLPAHRGPGRARRRPARAARRDARRARARRGAVRRAARGARLRRAGRRGRPDGLVLPCADDGRRAAQLVHLRGAAARRRRPRRGLRRPRPARDRGEGVHAQHPPDVASTASASAFARASSRSPRTPRARLLALPFFASIAERQIDRVCEALAEALLGDWT